MATYEVQTLVERGEPITIVKLSGQLEPANIRALFVVLQDRAQKLGVLRILIDETEMKAGLMGFNDLHDLLDQWRGATALLKSSRIAVWATNPVIRGLNQTFRLLAKLERQGSMSAFSKRADALAWLVEGSVAR